MSKHLKSLQDVYDAVPRIDCKGLCHGACGPVPATRREIETINAASLIPFGTRADGYCSMLAGGRCSVYAQRPLLCRLWGVLKKMRCPHGCEPERWLSDAQSTELLEAAARLGGGYDLELLGAMLAQVTEELAPSPLVCSEGR